MRTELPAHCPRWCAGEEWVSAPWSRNRGAV